MMNSSGPMEGTISKVKTMKRQAYGFRDHEFFELKILAIHETKSALVAPVSPQSPMHHERCPQVPASQVSEC